MLGFLKWLTADRLSQMVSYVSGKVFETEKIKLTHMAVCAGCHQDFLTQDILVLSPPRQVLEFLVEYVKTDNKIPIYQVCSYLTLMFLSQTLGYRFYISFALVLPRMSMYPILRLSYPTSIYSASFPWPRRSLKEPR
jgi:hypothetical protein